MDRGELPTWLDATTAEVVLEHPRLAIELRAILHELQRQVWYSSVRLTPKGEEATPFKVCARTVALSSGAVVTLVTLGLESPVANRPRTLRRVIHAYSGRFNQEKWNRTRWFLVEAGDGLAELKLQALPNRQIWFLQEFEIT